jgi:hypothetical protein
MAMIIGLSGYAQSGKDTVAELLCLNYGFKRISFALPMRDAVYTLNPFLESGNRVADLVDEYGWDVAKGNAEVRRLLQVFGTDVGRELFGETFWIDQAFKRAAEYQRVVFSDVRFPNEAKAIQNKGGDVWRINRHNHAPVNHHISEHAMDNHLFKHVIYNDGTLDELSDEVFMLAKELGL